MFEAFSDTRLAGSRVRAAAIVERLFRFFVFDRERLCFDTRFSPNIDRASGLATFYVVFDGVLEVDDSPPSSPPVLYILAESELERPQPGSRRFRVRGARNTGFELRVRARDVLVPIGLAHGPRVVSVSTFGRMRGIVDLLDGPRDHATCLARVIDALEALAEAQLLSFGVGETIVREEDPALARIARAAAPFFESYVQSPSLADLKRSTGLSLAQLGRDVIRFVTTFDVVGDGFRETARIMRLRTAAVWLSCPDTGATEVADAVGYSSLDAMTRAFREAGLPPPSVVRERTLHRD